MTGATGDASVRLEADRERMKDEVPSEGGETETPGHRPPVLCSLCTVQPLRLCLASSLRAVLLYQTSGRLRGLIILFFRPSVFSICVTNLRIFRGLRLLNIPFDLLLSILSPTAVANLASVFSRAALRRSLFHSILFLHVLPSVIFVAHLSPLYLSSVRLLGLRTIVYFPFLSHSGPRP